MSQSNYDNHIIEICDEIYIDSCSLMNEDAAKSFFSNYHDEFLRLGKKIIIIKEIRAELSKLLEKSEKEKLSRKALELLQANDDIVQIEEGQLTEEDVNKSFADPPLLARLIQSKPNITPLLITNDKKLSMSANQLNDLPCIHGHQIYVCFIRPDGTLGRGKYDKKIVEPVIQKVVNPIRKKVVALSKKEITRRHNLVFRNPSDNSSSSKAPGASPKSSTTRADIHKQKTLEKKKISWKVTGKAVKNIALIGVGFLGSKFLKR